MDSSQEQVLQALVYLHSHATDNKNGQHVLHNQEFDALMGQALEIVVSHFHPHQTSDVFRNHKRTYSSCSEPDSDSEDSTGSIGEAMDPDSRLQAGYLGKSVKDTEYRSYMVACKDPTKGTSHTQELERFLRNQIHPDLLEHLVAIKNGKGEVLAWEGVVLDERGRGEASRHPDLMSLQEEPEPMTFADYESREVARRWIKQEDADPSPVAISRYPGLDSDNSGFVHVEHAGKGSFIYIIEAGVNLQVRNIDGEFEFDRSLILNGEEQVLQTDTDREKHPRKFEDPHRHSHGTSVASKAAGRKYGVAKAATVISVKDEKSKFGTVLGLILNDLHNHPHRAKRSVISLSRSWNLRWNQGAANNDSAREVYLKPLMEILDLGVPFVVSGGNWAKKSTFVERFPQVLASDEVPLIVVGAATIKGRRSKFAQKVPHRQSMIYAPGEHVSVQLKEDKSHSSDEWGSSYSAPLVAGVIAIHLADPKISSQWNQKNGIDRVRAIREYVRSDASSWVRPGGCRIIWNGASRNDHVNASTSVNTGLRNKRNAEASNEEMPERGTKKRRFH